MSQSGRQWWQDLSDEEALLRCRNGDAEAFRALYERYYSVLFGTAFLMTGNRQVSQELVQDAFLSAWQKLASLRRGTSFKPWIVRILVNFVLAERRKRQLPTVDVAEVMATLGEEAPDNQIVREVHAKQLLDALPDDDLRRVILLRYYADLTVPEIAQVTRAPEGTVKSRLNRAIGFLRSVVERDAND